MSLSEARAIGALDAICDEVNIGLYRPLGALGLRHTLLYMLLTQPIPSKQCRIL